ncbi:hypothetical protein AAF712_015546 [Marasmius tenuissimus]|uniref:RNase H type-1 domain-containing protein n=1 Tax=Marasmius tenuissimus TaxID=585030 RepID=A0ABR2Z921_9AGAR
MPPKLPPKPVVDLSCTQDRIHKGPWLVYQGPRPGVYDHQTIAENPELNGLARAYDNYDKAERDFSACRRSGILDALNAAANAKEQFVVIKGYEVGIFVDCLSAFIIGLRWEPELGEIVWCESESVAANFFQDKLNRREVETCKVEFWHIPKRMFNPVKKYIWTLVSA